MAKESGFRIGGFLLIALVFMQCAQNLLGDWQFYSTVAEGGGAYLPNTFVTVNSKTGQMTPIGPTGGTPWQDHIDIDPISGFLYGINVNSPGVITKIDVNTGQWTEAAAIQQDSNAVCLTALAFSPTGILYGVSDYLTFGVINMDTNTFTPVKALDIPGSACGMAFSPQGLLYLVDNAGSGDNYKQRLRTIDVSTGNITSSKVLTGKYCVGDIDFAPDGYIYHTNYSWYLFKFNPATGKQTDAGGGDIGPFGGIASVPVNAKGTAFIYKYNRTDTWSDTNNGSSWQTYRKNKTGYLVFEPNDNNTASAWFIDTWTAKDPNTNKMRKYYEQEDEKSLGLLRTPIGKNTMWVITWNDDGDNLTLSGKIKPLKIGTSKPSIAATLTGTEIWDINEGDYKNIGSGKISMSLDVFLTFYTYTHTGEAAVACVVDYLEDTLKYQQGSR